MSKKREQGMDLGYGVAENIARYMLLHRILTPADAKEYREQLQKENKDAYDGFLEYEEYMSQ